ncbi:MAG: hypothetical protein P8R36_05555 [Actinomycetota bacterium]|jgi:hypothetical protein|nr:hypothetical protein [Actinomycetota bacterium]
MTWSKPVKNQSDTVVTAQGTSIYAIPKSSLSVARPDGIAFAINLAQEGYGQIYIKRLEI